MKDRKQFTYKLNDDKQYIFSERNREDKNYMVFQDRVRSKKFKFIQDHVTGEDERITLLGLELGKFYEGYEIDQYIFNDVDELKRIAFDSFKISSPEISFEKFNELIPPEDLSIIVKLIYQIEFKEPSSDTVIAKELGVAKLKVEQWRESNPDLYSYLKRNIKKKV